MTGPKRKAFLTLAATLGVFSALAQHRALPAGHALTLSARDREAAEFTACTAGARVTCVASGDTFWYRGTEIRLADYASLRTACAAGSGQADGARARLGALLGAGPFTLAPTDRDADGEGRALRLVTREGRSLGAQLAARC